MNQTAELKYIYFQLIEYQTLRMFILSPKAKTADRFFKGSLPLKNRLVLLVSTPIRSLDVAMSNCNFSKA